MAVPDWNALYRQDADTLGRIGQVLVRAEMPQIEVRLSRALAEAAVAAWKREGDVEGDSSDESSEERVTRHRAAALALIGLSIIERGRWDGEEMVVALDPVFIGNACDAADDLPNQPPL